MPLHNNVRKKKIAILIVILFTLSALYPLSLLFISQVYAHFAQNNLQSKDYTPAAHYYEKALALHASNPNAWKNLGYVYYHLAEISTVDKASQLMKKAKEAYLAARRLNPIDAQTAYGLARVEALLEQMFGYLDTSAYNARPYFEDAIQLRPNSILYHSALARYLYQKNDKQALLKVVSNLTFIYPKVYAYLKREKYWSPDVRDAVRIGLEKCIAEGNLLQNAHAVMSSLMAEEKNLDAAVFHYEKSLARPGAAGDTAPNLRLADFYLEQGKLEEAEMVFWKALSLSANREQSLKSIAGIYRKNHLLSAFDEFYLEVARRYSLSRHMDIMHAQILIELERFDDAKNIIERLNLEEPMAEAYYELYRIAEKKRNHEAMTLAIAKASIHDRANVRYHKIFSRLLIRENDFEKAEREAGLAIRFSPTPSPGLYALRADIRWKQKNYAGAAQDYEAAAKLQPANVHYFARMAAASEKAGNLSEARRAYQKAAELDSDNPTYQDRLNAIGATRIE